MYSTCGEEVYHLFIDTAKVLHGSRALSVYGRLRKEKFFFLVKKAAFLQFV